MTPDLTDEELAELREYLDGAPATGEVLWQLSIMPRIDALIAEVRRHRANKNLDDLQQAGDRRDWDACDELEETTSPNAPREP